jgi:hypothetical protein
MRPLSAHDVIKIWEMGRNRHLLDKALIILSAGIPEMTWDQLAALTIGQRDGCLFDLHEKTFGSTLKGVVACPQCTEHVEFTVSTADFQIPQEPDFDGKENAEELMVRNAKIKFRLPNSIDLATAAGCEDVETAYSLIAQRCVMEAIANEKSVTAKELSAEVINRLAARMAEREPQTEIFLDFRCPTCSYKWQMVFDIVTFLWKEISMYAKRLLQEVHTLASAYKWREADILSMSPIRRRYYLEMVP